MRRKSYFNTLNSAMNHPADQAISPIRNKLLYFLLVAFHGKAPLAQLAEQLTLNQWVRGSIP